MARRLLWAAVLLARRATVFLDVQILEILASMMTGQLPLSGHPLNGQPTAPFAPGQNLASLDARQPSRAPGRKPGNQQPAFGAGLDGLLAPISVTSTVPSP